MSDNCAILLRGCSHPTVVVALNHPGFWPRNVINRRYGSLVGAEAEHALLRAGVQRSGFVPNPSTGEHNVR